MNHLPRIILGMIICITMVLGEDVALASGKAPPARPARKARTENARKARTPEQVREAKQRRLGQFHEETPEAKAAREAFEKKLASPDAEMLAIARKKTAGQYKCMLRAFDRNRNKRLDEPEQQHLHAYSWSKIQRRTEYLAQWDTNRNGKLTPAEMAKGKASVEAELNQVIALHQEMKDPPPSAEGSEQKK